MEVRSYYASTVQAAMELACQELGPDALLIQSARSAPEHEHMGRYEVVFAGELRPQTAAAPKANAGRGNELPVGLGPVDLVSKGTDFGSVLSSLGAPNAAVSKRSPTLELHRSQPRATIPDLACSPGLGRNGYAETVVAFVGPSGAGKTTTIMKLSLMHGVLMSRPVRLFSFDPLRVGTSLRLKRFAELLKLEFQEFEGLGDLSSALDKPGGAITFIDTGSYADCDVSVIAGGLLQHRKLEVQLVLRADRKTADNIASVRRFSPFDPARLIITAFDESADHTELAGLVESAGIPVSFLGVGPRIPEDLEPASSRRLTELILNGWQESSRTAA